MAGTTRKPAASRTGRRPVKKETLAVTKAKKQMWSVVLFALGLLLLAFTLIPGEKLWLSIHSVLFGSLGWSVYFLAPLVLYIAVIAALDRPLTAVRAKLWQVIILILMISGAIQIVGPGLPDEGTAVDNIVSLWEGGKALEGGGIAGVLFAWPLFSLFEKTGATIIIALAIFVFVMLITGSSLVSLFHYLSKPVKGTLEAYADAVEQRANRPERQPKQKRALPSLSRTPTPAEAAKTGKFSFDIDISGDSDPEDMDRSGEDINEAMPLPEHPVTSPPPEEPFFGVPVDAPVEYISPGEFESSLSGDEARPERGPVGPRHPLSDEIARAEAQADRQNAELSELIDRFLGKRQRQETSGAYPAEAPPERPELLTLGELEQSPSAKNEVGFSLSKAAKERRAQRKAPILKVLTPDGLLPERIENREPPDVPAQEYRQPSVGLLSTPAVKDSGDVTEELRQNAQTLVDTLKSFGVQTRITDISRGPAVTRYELQPSAGVKISKITGLADDIALNLASAGIRIEAPIPNKAAVGIEVPNKTVSTVSIREIIDSKDFGAAGSSLSVAMGKDIAGNIVLADLGRMPHLLIAGATGSGKSVCINSIIVSLLYKSTPDEVKLLMVDPKVVELGIYNGIPHLLVPVVTDPRKAAGALGWAVAEMLKRYKTFAENNVRDLAGYNRLAESDRELGPMPKIVIIIDELADLMMAAPGEVEDSICRLAQMARAAGMHLVIATQRPSVDVITGVIKANIPSRIAFAVSSQVDSRTILDMGGAEKLLGRGDMLFYPVGAAKPLRVQGCFVTDTEVEQVVNYVKAGEGADYDQDVAEDIERLAVAEKKKGKAAQDDGGGFGDEDEMLPQAIECVVEMGMASTSSLQRRLKLGYARAARIIDQLEQKGVVGPFEGSKPRQVLITRDRWLEMKLSGQFEKAGEQLSFDDADRAEEEAPF